MQDPSERDPLTIGEVSRLSGVSTKTIRYYEDISLLPAPARNGNGYRRYSNGAVDMLRFVAKARGLGFSLKDVEELLALWRNSGRRSSDVRSIVLARLRELDRGIRGLEQQRDRLGVLAARCRGDNRPDCAIVDDLTHP